MPTALRAALDEFSVRLTANFQTAGQVRAQPEDQLKAPVVRLLEQAGTALGLSVVARTEATAGEYGVRPDVGVAVGGLLTGHVELKAPGKGVRPRAFTDEHDREQFRRLADHPNLVYADGNAWALYRKGELIGQIVTAAGDIRTDGVTAYSDADCISLELLLRDFLLWQPIVPGSPKALAEVLAPLTRLLREAVAESLRLPGSSLADLAGEWRNVFFPDADDAQFADAYAQTVTYALLLARVEGETDLHSRAADRLDARHGLLAQVLRVLAQPAARAEVEAPVSLLERVIGAVEPGELEKRARGRDIWLYFYEDFLGAYDPRLRRQRGVYFTPAQVVKAQVNLVAQLLRERFDRELGFASDDVVVLDPAVGTGTYLLAALEHGAAAVESAFGPGAVAGRATAMAAAFHGFELLVGSYAVAHLRLAQDVLRVGGELPVDGTHVYLTDTLESPFAAPQAKAHVPLFERKLAEENERARHVKAETPVLVCLGNPPYFRQVIDPEDAGVVERQGGWVREDEEGKVGILRDFLRDTPGIHAKNLYNLYVYFWRWALWKVCERGPRQGIVSFITASSYLRGPGFAGMRRHMRETFDELWILDLGGEGRGARRSENVFAIQTPVAIAIGVRSEPRDDVPAEVRYTRIEGTEAEKLARLADIHGFHDLVWETCLDGWTEPFLPRAAGDYFAWPALTDLFPWQHSGVQMKRTWPIAPDRDTLAARWKALVGAPRERRAALFRETRDRKVGREYPATLAPGVRLAPIGSVPASEPVPSAAPYAYRSFDRQYRLEDNRVGDYLRPALQRTAGAPQLFLTSLLTGLLGDGPAAVVTHLVPDLHHFRGSYGAKDVVPLWRDLSERIPNVTADLLERLGAAHSLAASPEDLFAYCYALLVAPSYTVRFAAELEIPGPRIPLTRDPALFGRAVSLGRELIWLHTFGERLVPPGKRAGRIPQGAARNTVAVPSGRDRYPERHRYDEDGEELHVGDGIFAPVSPQVRYFSVSGLEVVGSWLDYRMKAGAGRRSSPLDEIRPATWPAAFSEELLRVLWILERTVALGPELDRTLDAIAGGPLFAAGDLPGPTDEERRPPAD